MIDLTVVLPVYNEEKGIKNTVSAVLGILNKTNISYELLCVENGSTDTTLAVLHTIARRWPKVTILQSEKGWGNAVRKAIPLARGRLFCYMVSDGQVDAKYIRELYHLYMHKTDQKLVLCKVWRVSRENMKRLINSRIYNSIVKFLLGYTSRDSNATPKIIETKLLKSLDLRSTNFALDMELLYKLKKRNLYWKEIPVRSNKRDTGSSTTKLQTVGEAIRSMVFLRLGLF